MAEMVGRRGDGGRHKDTRTGLKTLPAAGRRPLQKQIQKLIGEAVADDAPERLETVFPGDFFAFFVGAAGVGDGDFVDTPLPLRDLGGNFRFEAEAIGFELDALKNLAAKNFIAGFHIGEF